MSRQFFDELISAKPGPDLPNMEDTLNEIPTTQDLRVPIGDLLANCDLISCFHSNGSTGSIRFMER